MEESVNSKIDGKAILAVAVCLPLEFATACCLALRFRSIPIPGWLYIPGLLGILATFCVDVPLIIAFWRWEQRKRAVLRCAVLLLALTAGALTGVIMEG